MVSGVPLLRTETEFPVSTTVPWLASLIVAVIFFLAEHNFYYSISESAGTALDNVVNRTAEGSLPRRLSFLFMGLMAAIALMRGGGYRLSMRGGYAILPLLFIGWAGLSILWAEDMALTFRRLIVLASFCLTAAAMSKHLQLSEIIRIVFLVSGAFLVTGIFAELSLGTFLPLDPDYRFQGTLHSNSQSIICAILVFSALALRSEASGRFGRIFFSAVAVTAGAFLILTKSRTCFVSMISALVAFQIITSPNFRKHGLVLAFSIVALIFLLFGGILFPAIKHGVSLGRDQTTSIALNGRMPLWSACLSSIDQAKVPILGFGYGGFWTPDRIERISISQSWGESMRQGVGVAHSMYLDILLALGPIGLLLYVLVILGGIRRAIRHYFSTHAPGYAFIMVLLIFCMMQSTLESSPINHSFYTLVVFTGLTFLGFREPYRIRGDRS